jgi:GT2 family glycosyltransferase
VAVSRTALIIVNYDRYEDTAECVDSLLRMDGIGESEIVVVDNCSANDSYGILKSRFGRCHVLKTEENNGYAAGNNFGIRYAAGRFDPEYFWILNPDTIADPGALLPLLDFAASHPEAGILGSRLVFYPEGDVLQALGGGYIELKKSGRLEATQIYHGEKIDAKLPEALELDHLVGASFFIKRAVIDGIGLLDESYFMYIDETEYCLRAKRAGWKIYALSASTVFHKEGWRRGDRKSWGTYYSSRNTLFLIQKYYRRYLAANIAFAFLGVLKLLIKNLLYGKPPLSFSVLRLRGIADFFRKKSGKVTLGRES